MTTPTRNEKMFAMACDGTGFAVIGKHFGVSRNRARYACRDIAKKLSMTPLQFGLNRFSSQGAKMKALVSQQAG